MSRTRVPETIDAFQGYINYTDDYLQAIDPGSGLPNWQRLGLTNANASDWQSKRVYWRDTLYIKYSNPELSSSPVKTTVRRFMRDFRKFANPLLTIMAANPAAGHADEIEFRFKIHRKNPTYHTNAITEKCFAYIKSLGGGEMKFTCRTATAEGRARKADMADSVQIAYSIGNTAPAHAADGTVKEIFTKAAFILNTGGDGIGKYIYVWVRWYNTRHPQLAGPWSGMYAAVIA